MVAAVPEANARRLSRFERADSFFQRLPVRIVVARVHESVRVAAIHIAFKRSGKMNRCRHGAVAASIV